MSYQPFPPVDGTPGTAAPTEALQVGGTDGTDLRAVLVDTTGRPIIQQPNNVLLAATAETITSTVTSVATTASAHGRCVVVSLKNTLGSGTWPAACHVRVRNTSNGILTNWQNVGLLINGTSAQMYFNVPVTNGDTVVLDLIAVSAIGTGGVTIAAVLSPLAIATDLVGGRTPCLGSLGAQALGGAVGAATMVAAPGANWRIYVRNCLCSCAAASAVSVYSTIAGTATTLLDVPTGHALVTILNALFDPNVAVTAFFQAGTAATDLASVTYDIVPA